VEKISELRSAEAEEYIANTRQGWKKPGVVKKKPSQWVFWFLDFFGFFLYICPEERVF
jgi:hypothetical protein